MTYLERQSAQLTDEQRAWIQREHDLNQRSLTDIAREFNRKHGTNFKSNHISFVAIQAGSEPRVNKFININPTRGL